ncbi:checkpoint protein HUS1 isoform X3 [Falco peregrinus]|uniref:checkpoint protein HUS1 isoform X3 n=1 Tax=Falco peregrinus TaxID=8954 RepID=UPI00247A1819|nr:checkpoint protein HUS1 isoform X3 [Falco peregrinus]
MSASICLHESARFLRTSLHCQDLPLSSRNSPPSSRPAPGRPGGSRPGLRGARPRPAPAAVGGAAAPCDSGLRSWISPASTTSAGNFFDEFQMEGVAPEHNEIYLEVVPENLSRALKTAQSAKTVKIKLTNKHCPCLRVAVELVIEANLSGEMNLKIETDLVSVTTHFKDLGNPPWASVDECQDSAQDRDLESMAEARIDIKKLQQLLAGQQVNPTKALCNIVSKRIVHFILLHEDVSLQYFIPALA